MERLLGRVGTSPARELVARARPPRELTCHAAASSSAMTGAGAFQNCTLATRTAVTITMSLSDDGVVMLIVSSRHAATVHEPRLDGTATKRSASFMM
jgi:hypothetical protein